MRSIKGPAIFLAQFAGDAPPFNSLKAIAGWAAGLGFKGVQIPSWDARLFDLAKAAESQTRSEEHTSELQSRLHLVCRLLLEKKKKKRKNRTKKKKKKKGKTDYSTRLTAHKRRMNTNVIRVSELL